MSCLDWGWGCKGRAGSKAGGQPPYPFSVRRGIVIEWKGSQSSSSTMRGSGIELGLVATAFYC